MIASRFVGGPGVRGVPSRAVSQLLWPEKDGEVWFSLEKTMKRPVASIYTHCETALTAGTVDTAKCCWVGAVEFPTSREKPRDMGPCPP
jgi:hypothetical protein